jgi:hypothetical protein
VAERFEWLEPVSVTPDRLVVRVLQERVPDVNRALVGEGIDVFSVIPKSMNLEDLFLDLIQEGGDADQDSDRASETVA